METRESIREAALGEVESWMRDTTNAEVLCDRLAAASLLRDPSREMTDAERECCEAVMAWRSIHRMRAKQYECSNPPFAYSGGVDSDLIAAADALRAEREPKVKWIVYPGSVRTLVRSIDGRPDHVYAFDTEPEARAVCDALNKLAQEGTK